MRLLLTLTAAVLALAAPALAADPGYQRDGPADPRSPGTLTCAGDAGTVTPSVGPAEIVAGSDTLDAGGFADVRAPLSIAGTDGCAAAGGTRARIEVIPPPDTQLADWHEPPVNCVFGTAPATACRVAYRTGDYGGLVVDDARGATPVPWALSDAAQPTAIEIPVTYVDLIDSFGTTTERRCGPLGPCAPAAADRRVQIVVTFIPGDGGTPAPPVLTTVGMLDGGETECCDDITGPQNPRVKVQQPQPLPARTARSDLRRGVDFLMEVTRGTTVSLRLSAHGKTIASIRKVATRKDTMSLVLKVGKVGLTRLGSGTQTLTLTKLRTGGSYARLALRSSGKAVGR
jgi:hypothetical protein